MIDIPASPRGVPQIDVTFDIDASGILSVSAKDQSSGREQAVKVTPSSGLSGDEIKRIIDEAKYRSDEDRKQKEETHSEESHDWLAAVDGQDVYGVWLAPPGKRSDFCKGCVKDCQAVRTKASTQT